MKYIKQYGIQRSGTNYFRVLIEMNSECRVLSNICGYKHGEITGVTNMRQIKTELHASKIKELDRMFKNGEIPKVVIIKEPLSWIVSISKYLRKEITADFINEQMHRYCELNLHWIDNCDMVIHYGDMLLHPQDVVISVANKFNIPVNLYEFNSPEFRMHRGGDIPAEQNVSHQRFDPTYYTEYRYLNELTEDQVLHINSYPLLHLLNKTLNGTKEKSKD